MRARTHMCGHARARLLACTCTHTCTYHAHIPCTHTVHTYYYLHPRTLVHWCACTHVACVGATSVQCQFNSTALFMGGYVAMAYIVMTLFMGRSSTRAARRWRRFSRHSSTTSLPSVGSCFTAHLDPPPTAISTPRRRPSRPLPTAISAPADGHLGPCPRPSRPLPTAKRRGGLGQVVGGVSLRAMGSTVSTATNLGRPLGHGASHRRPKMFADKKKDPGSRGGGSAR